MLDCPRQGTPCSPTHRKSWPTLPHTERPPSSPRGSPPPPRPPGPGVILPSRDTWNYANAWNVRALRPFPCCTTPQWSLCGRKWSAGTITSTRSEEHTSELQSRFDLVCRLLLEKKKTHNLRETQK